MQAYNDLEPKMNKDCLIDWIVWFTVIREQGQGDTNSQQQTYWNDRFNIQKH